MHKTHKEHAIHFHFDFLVLSLTGLLSFSSFLFPFLQSVSFNYSWVSMQHSVDEHHHLHSVLWSAIKIYFLIAIKSIRLRFFLHVSDRTSRKWVKRNRLNEKELQKMILVWNEFFKYQFYGSPMNRSSHMMNKRVVETIKEDLNSLALI